MARRSCWPTAGSSDGDARTAIETSACTAIRRLRPCRSLQPPRRWHRQHGVERSAVTRLAQLAPQCRYRRSSAPRAPAP
jgi:hypothetical protein